MEKIENFEGKKRKPDCDLTELDNQKREKGNNKKNKHKNKNKIEGEEAEQIEIKDWGISFDPKRDLKSEKFENYYRTQLAQYFENEEQFQLFIDKMREKLPCVFRINTANPFWENFREILTNQNLVKDLLNGDDHGIKISPMYLTNSEYWRDLIFNINIPRFELKRNESLSTFHKLIQKSVD